MKYIDVNGQEWSTKKGFSIEDISQIKKEDEKFLHEMEIEKAKQRYLEMYQHIELSGFGAYIDPCVDAECVLPLQESDGLDYWAGMYEAMVSSVGARLEDSGICASDYGIPY